MLLKIGVIFFIDISGKFIFRILLNLVVINVISGCFVVSVNVWFLILIFFIYKGDVKIVKYYKVYVYVYVFCV